MKKYLFPALLCLFGISLFILNLLGIQFCLDIQQKHSLPWRFYIKVPLKKPFNTEIKPGDYIMFKTDRRMLPYFKPNQLFGKKVIGIPGDMLVTKGRDFYLNNRFLTRALKTDSQGNPVPVFVYKGKIPKDCYFVLGLHHDSFDSRYWGFVCKPAIVGKIIPLVGGKDHLIISKVPSATSMPGTKKRTYFS